MPEGHTIHRLARDHQKWFAGQKLIVMSPQGRFEAESETLSGNVLRKTSAHGKHLFYHWADGRIVHIHLGLYGKFRLHKNPPPEPRGAVRMRVIGKERSFDLNGPNRCELIDDQGFENLRARLGEDPLSKDASPERVWAKFQNSRAAIGSVLLNQSIIAGIGNVYRAEILFLLGIDPTAPANQMTRDSFNQLWKLTVKLLKIGVKYNRIITTEILPGKPASRLRAAERLNIYKRKTCPKCNSRVKDWELANRKMYACLTCQTSPTASPTAKLTTGSTR